MFYEEFVRRRSFSIYREISQWERSFESEGRSSSKYLVTVNSNGWFKQLESLV